MNLNAYKFQNNKCRLIRDRNNTDGLPNNKSKVKETIAKNGLNVLTDKNISW